MHRAQRKLLEEVRHADLVIEARDARLPLGSANPELQALGERRELNRLVLFTKADLADPKETLAWTHYFEGTGDSCLFLDTGNRGNTALVLQRARELCRLGQQKYQRRGIRPPAPRLIVVGIPNVGKSTLINRLLHRKRLRTGPEPGVTRDALWVQVRGGIQLMDTPGILIPRIETEEQAQRLAWIGALPQHLLRPEDLAQALLAYVLAHSPGSVEQAYHLSRVERRAPLDTLAEIARIRGLVTRGAAPDLARASDQVLRDFREGRLGRFTLEAVPTHPPASARPES